MFEDQFPTPYDNAAMAPARKAYFDTLQKEFAEEEPTPLGEITPTDENINEAMKAYRQMLNVTPEEQATKQQIQRQLALDPIRDFLNPQLQKVYGKGLKLPSEPGIEASPTAK